jgi:hypothetical protein
MKSVTFVVIGLRGAIRSKSLIRFLESGNNTHLVDPIAYEEQKYRGQLASNVHQTLLQGRPLSPPEAGCALAHRAAVLKAQELFRLDDKLNWVVIAEDDADLSEEGARWLANYLGNLRTQAPALVNLYSPRQAGKRGVDDDKRPPRRQLVLRPGTVCYAINRPGLVRLQRFTKSPVASLADWPLYFADLKFFFTEQFSVSEYPSQSTIGVRKRIKIFPRLAMVTRQILRIPYLSRIHRTSLSGTLIWVLAPVFRDLYHRAAGTYSRK